MYDQEFDMVSQQPNKPVKKNSDSTGIIGDRKKDDDEE
jgi:hypothetical protein